MGEDVCIAVTLALLESLTQVIAIPHLWQQDIVSGLCVPPGDAAEARRHYVVPPVYRILPRMKA